MRKLLAWTIVLLVLAGLSGCCGHHHVCHRGHCSHHTVAATVVQ